MRRNYTSLFAPATTPMFDMSSMYGFGEPEPSPIKSLSGRFNFKPKTTLAEDAENIAANEDDSTFSATKALLDYINKSPNRSDYELSGMGKFAAALSGLAAGYKNPVAGVQTALEMHDRPYRNALEEYGSKLPGLELAANVEEAAYGRDMGWRKLYQDYLKDQGDLSMKGRELNIKQGELDETIRNNKAEYELNKSRYAAEGWKEFTDDKGDTYIFKPGTTEKKLIGRSIQDREVKVSESNAASNRIGANAAASNASTNASRLAYVDMPVANANIERDRNLNQLTQEQISASQQIDPQEQLYAQAMAAREIVGENPDWANFINDDGSINFTAHQGWLWDDNEEFNKFLKAVKDRIQSDLTAPDGTVKPITERKYRRPTPLGRSITIPPPQ